MITKLELLTVVLTPHDDNWLISSVSSPALSHTITLTQLRDQLRNVLNKIATWTQCSMKNCYTCENSTMETLCGHFVVL